MKEEQPSLSVPLSGGISVHKYSAISFGKVADTINGWSTQGVALTKRMMWSGLETASLEAAIELESHTQLYVRLTTKNFEEATRARKEGRKPEFLD